MRGKKENLRKLASDAQALGEKLAEAAREQPDLNIREGLERLGQSESFISLSLLSLAEAVEQAEARHMLN